jgi:hypothetical protein
MTTKSGVVVHAVIPAPQRQTKENHKFKASTGYSERPSMKKMERSQVQWLTPVITAPWEAEVRRIRVQGQPGLS